MIVTYDPESKTYQARIHSPNGYSFVSKRAYCLADLADDLNLERSTVAALLNELKHF